MKMKRGLGAFLVTLAGLLTAPAANAELSVFNDLDGWVAAVGGSSAYQRETFNDAVLNPGLTITGPQLQVSTPGTAFFAGHQVLHGVVDSASSITISFSTPTIAMASFWDLLGPGGPGSQITLNLVSGGLETYTNFYPNTLGYNFRGFVSSNPFTSIILTEGTGCCQETFEMEDMKYVQVVPEPETYAMLLAGLGLMGFVARRRRRKFAVA